MAGKNMKVSFLVDIMLKGTGTRSKEDLKYHLFEVIYGMIREAPWPWNYIWDRLVTYAPLTETSTFTWTAGQQTLTASGALAIINVDHTGRLVSIDNRQYRVVKVTTATNQITLDSRVPAAGTGVQLTFYRPERYIKGASVSELNINSLRVVSSTYMDWKLAKSGRYPGPDVSSQGGGQPEIYEVVEDYEILPPLYAPLENGGTAAGLIEDGTYDYFFTYYDKESGIESAPGPTLRKTYSGGPFQQSFGFGSANTSAVSTYTLRLYRSKAISAGGRVAMFLIGEKDSSDAADFVLDNMSLESLLSKDRYYDGAGFLARYHPWPDGVYSEDIRRINGWGGRPDPDDYVMVGRNNVLTDLLPLGAAIFNDGAQKDGEAQMGAIVKFRRQLSYLIRQNDDGNRDDPGIGETVYIDGRPDSPSDPTNTYSWKF